MYCCTYTPNLGLRTAVSIWKRGVELLEGSDEGVRESNGECVWAHAALACFLLTLRLMLAD